MKAQTLLLRLLLAVILLIAAMSVASAQYIIVSAGTYLKNNGANISLYNTSVQNNGTISSTNGSFVFSGSSNNIIAGNGTTNLNALQLSKQNGAQLQLQKNISVTGAVSFSGGILDLGNNQLQLVYPGGMLQNESPATRLTASGTGEVYITQTLNAPAAVNPGNLGATITSSENLGATVIKRGHKVQVNATNDQSIARYFTITPANNTALNATLKFSYLDAELNNNPENGMAIWQKTTAWASIGANGADAGNNYVQKNSINTFTSFTLGKTLSGALPLQLTSFTISCKGAGAQAQWTTENEVNTKQFVIEKSSDGINWTMAAVVPAQGNSPRHSYETLIATGTASYFRLKMEDMDGKFTYSAIKMTDCSGAENIIIGPNPTGGKIIITATLNSAEAATIVISDVNGRLVLSRPWQVQKGMNVQTLDISGFPAGIYMVNIQGNVLKQVRRIVKQ
jgi:hypothetical protein